MNEKHVVSLELAKQIQELEKKLEFVMENTHNTTMKRVDDSGYTDSLVSLQELYNNK